MRPVHSFTVVASLPKELDRLRYLAHNLFWSWDHEIIALFRRLDRDLWESTGHNPVAMLGTISQKRYEEVLGDPGFLAHFNRCCRRLDDYLSSQSTWFHRESQSSGDWCTAYFSMEFAVTEAVPIYSGGLGVLAGDHMKSASDLGLPLIGVGLLYQKGYFKQFLNSDGWQQERYPTNDFYNMPIELLENPDGTPLMIQVELPGRPLTAQIWKMHVGRVEVLLLDTNVRDNRGEDQIITNQLYGGDNDMRLRQEILLGIGGIRALAALGRRPLVCHMNEGHSAFLALERIRMIMQEKRVDFAVAAEAVRPGNIFTTHTPVPAGIDRFLPEQIEKYFAGFREQLGISTEDFLALGRVNPTDKNELFCMAILAIKLSSRINGVSKLHGEVSRRMWLNVWQGVPDDEVPIGSVTNGIHYRSWISAEMAELYDRYIGPKWSEDPSDAKIWDAVNQIPAEELWRTHDRRRESLVAFVRRRLRERLIRLSAPPADIEAAEEVLDSSVLTIGFARRFATYKRAALLLHDLPRLSAILNNPEMPVQIIFAGKAHPHDNQGKELIRKLIRVARLPEFRRRLVFLENYDMAVSRYLVQGCDIWLNTPRRLQEASGTSGMKASANGCLNMSILDGWWDEAYKPGIGWAIGSDAIYNNLTDQDRAEANAIYELLEKDAAPLFYDRGPDHLPRGWIQRMKAAMGSLCPIFNSNRMVHQYARELYLSCAERSEEFISEDLSRARALAAWKAKIRSEWHNVRVLHTELDTRTEPRVGSIIKLHAALELGLLEPHDVAVELYAGSLDPQGYITSGLASPMDWASRNPDGSHEFVGEVNCFQSGQCGVTVRVRPRHSDLNCNFEMRLVTWA